MVNTQRGRAPEEMRQQRKKNNQPYKYRMLVVQNTGMRETHPKPEASSSNSSSGRSHGEIRSRCFVSRFFFWSDNISRALGTGLVVIGGVFVNR